MTTLNSLEIQGIRSFSPSSPETIYFEKPLTLIVGHNGAGKTTIVECLKMITSGILPPNSDKGKCFIHSNKLTKSTEVHAHIKLEYTTFNDDHISATRTYSLSNDRYTTKKTVFKACDNLMDITTDGNKRSISMKCTEMDNAVSTTMGLTRAMIDNVIFCHQDENNWALDDVSKVKSRFDDLLETSRYTKALVVLNKLKKEQDDCIKSKKACLDSYKSQILQIADIKKQIENNENDLLKTRTEIKELEEDVNSMGIKASNLKQEYDELCIMSHERITSEDLRDKLKIECDTIHNTLTEIYEEPLDVIEKYHKILSNELNVSEEKNSLLLSEINSIQDTLNGLYHKLQDYSKNNNAMFMRENKKSLEDRVANLQNDIIAELNIKGIKSYDEEMIQNAIDSLKNKLNDENLRPLIHNSFNKCKEIEDKLLDKSAELKMSLKMMESTNDDIKSLEQSIANEEDIKSLYNSLRSEYQICQDEINNNESKLNDLINKRSELLNDGLDIKLPNMKITKNDISIVTKVLDSIIEHDQESIATYLSTISKLNINQESLIEIVKRIVEEFAVIDDALYKDCMETMEQLLSPRDIICTNCGIKVELDEIPHSDVSFNAIVKIITNQRIKNYITYYSSLMDEEEASNNDISNINNEISALKTFLSTKRESLEQYKIEEELLSRQLEDMKILSKKLFDLNSKYNDQLNEINTLEDIIKCLELELKQTKEEHDKYKEELNKLEHNRSIKLSKIKLLMEQLNETKKELMNIDLFDVDEVPKETLNIDRLNSELTLKKNDQIRLGRNIMDHKNLLELLEKNINYKMKLNLLTEIHGKITEIMQKINGRNINEVKMELDDLNKRITESNMKIATLNGVAQTREGYIKELKNSLNSKEVQDIHTTYMNTFIELKTHIMTKDDLEKYIKYMEAGLHEYHLDKINCINNNLKRIWREVYTGNYIDYIAVQSNVDENSIPTSTTSKSYNYKIIMVTYSGVEIDMKGHCSAGERILTSLVIRIALIESFNTNCNFLALDEPTTNLDSDNIESLETSLAKLVNDSNFNFQLIVITHDEYFAKKMATLCSCDKYFSIEKTIEGSRIKTVTL